MLLDWVFDDKRVAAGLLVVWMAAVVAGLQFSMDIAHSEFMGFGPSAHMHFMTVAIDTWDKWWLLACATMLTTCVSAFMCDAIEPWLQNTVQDHKTKYLPYHKATCYLVSQVWTVYCSLMSIFGVALMMSQIDLLCVRLAAELLVNTYTSFKFMKHKCTDRRKYWLWTENHLQEAQGLAQEPPEEPC